LKLFRRAPAVVVEVEAEQLFAGQLPEVNLLVDIASTSLMKTTS
jgi:hypothetical protein